LRGGAARPARVEQKLVVVSASFAELKIGKSVLEAARIQAVEPSRR